jgi:hypothetical protein
MEEEDNTACTGPDSMNDRKQLRTHSSGWQLKSRRTVCLQKKIGDHDEPSIGEDTPTGDVAPNEDEPTELKVLSKCVRVIVLKAEDLMFRGDAKFSL